MTRRKPKYTYHDFDSRGEMKPVAMVRGPSDVRREEEAERYAAQVARKCRSHHAPCGGCMQGGLCDNYDGIESLESERSELEGLEYDSDEGEA